MVIRILDLVFDDCDLVLLHPSPNSAFRFLPSDLYSLLHSCLLLQPAIPFSHALACGGGDLDEPVNMADLAGIADHAVDIEVDIGQRKRIL